MFLQEGCSMIRMILVSSVVCLCAFASTCQNTDSLSGDRPSPATEPFPLLRQWEGLKYGMFIHFGMSTFAVDEYGHTPKPAATYAPTQLDVDQWISVARDAGMKYAVLTTKHCYGHCLWPSALTDYDVEKGPDKTDVVGAFVRACREHGIKPGFYYLLGWDTCHQTKMNAGEYEAFVFGQVEELLTRYGPITELWLDIPWDFEKGTAAVLERLYAHVKRLQPECLILMNQGFVDGRKVESRHPSWLRKKVGDTPVFIWPKDLNNGERILPPPAGHDPRIEHKGRTYYIPNEVCDTLLQRRWFWGRDDDLRPARIMFELYRKAVGRGSNLLLNVPPDTTGRIPEESVKRLMEIKAMIERPESAPAPLSWGKSATASNVYHGEADKWGPKKAIDIDLEYDAGTRWATDDGVEQAWLEVDLGESRVFSAAFLSEYLDRIRAFQLEILDADVGWRVIYQGRAIGGPGVTARFEAIESRKVRLHVTDSIGGPTLWDFEILHLP